MVGCLELLGSSGLEKMKYRKVKMLVMRPRAMSVAICSAMFLGNSVLSAQTTKDPGEAKALLKDRV